MNNLIETISKNNKLCNLVQKDNFVGWVFSIDYENALIMTNDEWKSNVRGIPHNSFLIATSLDTEKFATTQEIDKEVILLRVTNSCKLPQDDDMIKTRIDNYQNQQQVEDLPNQQEYDILTKNKMQFSGLECRVLGTFYLKNENLYLGSDIENYSTALKMKVYMPDGESLQEIVNYVDPIRKEKFKEDFKELGITKDVDPFRIGTVRYTSTDRLHRSDLNDLIPFSIQPSDFLARRTAVLGMTRTGKSNMIKQTVSVVKQVSEECTLDIGQIIYDINGEYANANDQDKGSIAEIYKDDCIRYRSVKTEGFKPLLNNFYTQLEEGHSIICDCIREKYGSSGAADLNLFMNSISFDKPPEGNKGETVRWNQKVALYKTLLYAAKFSAPSNYKVYFEANKDIRRLVNPDVDPKDGLTLYESKIWFTNLRRISQEIKKEITDIARNKKSKEERKYNPTDADIIDHWITEECRIMLNMLCMRNDSDGYFNGYKAITEAQKYHSFERDSDVREEIYNSLCEGKIVIIDLSVGNALIRERISKDIAEYIFNQSMKIFTEGKKPKNIVIYIEEAHNLIGKNMELTNTWPRIAKEGAKYRIGLVYATQEVSSIHPNILANTENWFVSHLNSEKEIKELAKFYDFGDFSQSLLKSQDIGFTRVKTLSSPFVIPIQIDKFDPSNFVKGVKNE